MFSTPLPLAMFIHPFFFNHVAPHLRHVAYNGILCHVVHTLLSITLSTSIRIQAIKKIETFCVIIYLKFMRLKILTPNTPFKSVLNTKNIFNSIKHLKMSYK
jgi:hypothetical protein